MWASGKNRRDPKAPLHTNFKIKATGEALYLSDETGTLIDQTPPLALASNQSAGRFPDGSGALQYFSTPTPGKPNTNPDAIAALSPPIFSHNAGFYETAFELSLSHPNPEATIYYTLDGSEPDPDNLAGSTYSYKNEYPRDAGHALGPKLHASYKSHLYDGPISIKNLKNKPNTIANRATTYGITHGYFPAPTVDEDNTGSWTNKMNKGIRALNRITWSLASEYRRALRPFNPSFDIRNFYQAIPEVGTKYYLDKATTVKAIAALNNETVSPTITKIFFIESREKYRLPVVSLTASERDLFDYENGILVAGKTHDDWFLTRESDDYSSPANWHAKGFDVPAYLELFESKAEHPLLSQKVGIRVHGATSRSVPNKTFRVYARKQYGTGKLSYRPNKYSKKKEFKRLLLRNSGNDHKRTLIRDGTIHRLLQGLNFQTLPFQPAILFLNGEYYGLTNIRERVDKHSIQDNMSLASNAIDLLKIKLQHDPTSQMAKSQIVATEGTTEKWQALLDLIETATPHSQHFYYQLNKLIDINSFIDYQISNIFINNTDWPGNNVILWRTSGDPRGSPASDGRWRWILYDTDLSFTAKDRQSLEFNALSYATSTDNLDYPNPRWFTKILKQSLLNPEFSTQFITRYADLLNTTLHPIRTTTIIDEVVATIEPEVQHHIHRWSNPKSIPRWRSHINAMVEFAQKRPDIQRQHLQDYFTLGDPYTVTIDVTSTADQKTAGIRQGTVVLNTLELGLTDEELPQPIAANERATEMAQVLALPWQGQYFSGMPITLTAKSADGYRFSHWSGKGMDLTPDQINAKTLTLTPNQDSHLTAVMEAID